MTRAKLIDSRTGRPSKRVEKVRVGAITYAVPNGAIPFQLAKEMYEAVMVRGRWYTRRGYEVPDRTTRALEFLGGLVHITQSDMLDELFR